MLPEGVDEGVCAVEVAACEGDVGDLSGDECTDDGCADASGGSCDDVGVGDGGAHCGLIFLKVTNFSGILISDECGVVNYGRFY